MQDLRLAVRALRARPLVSSVAILSLALGIGANTAIFSLVNSLLLRPLPVAHPDRLVIVSTGPNEFDQYSYTMLQEIRRHGEPFDGALALSKGGTSSLAVGGEPHPVDAQFVSGDYFSTLGVPAILGRTITLSDDVEGGGADGPVAVISYRFWQRHFGGAASVVGSRVTLERARVTIVGVAPPDFFGLVVGRAFDIALPIKVQPLVSPAQPLTDEMVWLTVMLRLKPGQSLDAATAALRAVQPQVRTAAMPKDIRAARSFLKSPFVLTPVGTGMSPLRTKFERPLMMILVVVALVLVIASANIANLMLARGAARRHELSLRLALGASRWRLARQFLIEAGVLAAIGALAAITFGGWASRTIVSQLSTAVAPVVLDPSLDWRVLAFTAATMVTTAMLFGIVPALRATRVYPIEALKEHGRPESLETGGTFSGSLIVAQVTLSLMIVIVAVSFLRTFERLARTPLGLDRDRVLVVTASAPTVPATDRNAFYHRLVRAVAQVPGVAAAGGSLNPPIVGTLRGDFVVSQPGTEPSPDAERISQANEVTPGWFAAYGIALRAGRDFDDHDSVGSQPVMIVNDAFVRRFFRNRTPIGSPIAVTYRMPPFGDVLLGINTIVGIVGDTVYHTIRQPQRPTIYFPLAQRDGPLLFTNFFITFRPAGGSPALLTRSVSAALATVNRDLVLAFRPLSNQVGDSLAQDRLIAMLSGFFAALALLLAGLGLYGVTAYAVARRRPEIGIRMALGAESTAVMVLVLRRVVVLVSIGIAVGAILSWWAAQFVSATLLYGVEARDMSTFGGSAAILAAVGALAGWVPARRASRTDPVEVLREG